MYPRGGASRLDKVCPKGFASSSGNCVDSSALAPSAGLIPGDCIDDRASFDGRGMSVGTSKGPKQSKRQARREPAVKEFQAQKLQSYPHCFLEDQMNLEIWAMYHILLYAHAIWYMDLMGPLRVIWS